ncbi:MAG: amino acid adenylation domain-containing protein [Halioglobus sp.]|nr:amino acid adenylation domain-containing protein [Halioglobus sp.]
MLKKRHKDDCMMGAEELLLDQLLAEEGISVAAPAESIPHTCSQHHGLRSGPLSYAQQRLFFLDRIMQEKTAYHIAYCVHFSAALDVDRLRASFETLVQRHPGLRTRFDFSSEQNQRLTLGEPIQQVLPAVEVDWESAFLPLGGVEALRTLLRDPCSAIALQALAPLQAYTARPFDLTRPPLSRQCLYELEDGSYLLQWVLHHIVSDGWSRDILVNDLAHYYMGNLTQTGSGEAGIDYIDYAIWQRSDARTAVLASELDYWRCALAPLPEPLELPADRRRPDRPSGRGAFVPVELGCESVDQVNRMARRFKVTPFVVLLAAYQVFLNRMSGQGRFLTGVPAMNREREEVHGIAGLFLNTLPLAADFSEPVTFIELLKNLQTQLGAAQNHQSVPFEQLVDALMDQRDASRPPLVQTLFSWQPASQAAVSLGSLQVEQFALPTMTSKLDLSLYLVEGIDVDEKPTVNGVFEYASDLFDTDTIVSFESAFQKILHSCLLSPEQPVQQLDILDRRDVALRDAWMGEQCHYKTCSVMDLFLSQLAVRPSATAVVDDARSLSYEGLDRRSDSIAAAIAKQLKARGVQLAPDRLIGVMLSRDCDLVATLLAIFKLGCAYLPLDSEYPAQRLNYIWEDSQAALLVTNRTLPDCGLDTPYALHLEDVIDRSLVLDKPIHFKSSDLAYVTYTSGSTGRPKGVMVEQGNVVSLLEWSNTVFAEDQCRGVLFSTSVCFDLSVFEIFMPLSAGGTVLVAESSLEWSSLAAHLAADPNLPDISLINTVPSAIRVLCRQDMIPSTVQTVTLCGELLPQTVVDELYDLPQIKDVIDLYGPSEDTVYSTWVRRTPQGRQSIGRPIANTQAYVLDPHMNRQPLGAVGELYLSGSGVARGYLFRDELTADRFLPNPFQRPDHYGDRLYRTGDLVKQLPDGDLVYLRRADDQVKLRGFRVEIGEVNHALWSVPGVEEAVSVVRHDREGTPMLVAYIVAAGDQTSSQDEWAQGVREVVARRLPEYMVPTSWVVLPALPQTPNGKIDRNALPAPAERRRKGIALSGPMQNELAALWREMLNLPVDQTLYADDDFFQLGGHSLLLLQLVHQVEARWGVPMSLEQVVVDTRLVSLAEAIELAKLSAGLTDSGRPETAVTDSAPQDVERFEI